MRPRRRVRKPRPAVIVQSDAFNPTHNSIVVCPMSSHLTGLTLFRIPIAPSQETGLQQESEIMVDKIGALPRTRIRQHIGRLSNGQMDRLTVALRAWLDLPD